jgi:hypothetical protein
MTKRPRQGSNWLGPNDNIPEMEVEQCRELFKIYFGVLSSFVEGSSYLYRFVGEPYNEFVPGTPAKTVAATNRGIYFTFDPRVIICLLDKFEKTNQAFRDAYNAYFMSDQPPSSPPSDTTKPN